MAAALDPSWILAHGIHDLGIGFFVHLQNGKPSLETRVASAGAKESIMAAQRSIQKALDCQTLIVSLFTEDVDQLLHHLRLLEGPLTPEVDAMIAAADINVSAQSVRDFKSRIDSVTLAYGPLANKIIKAAEHGSATFTPLALRDAAKVEKHAIELYSWARTFLPKDSAIQAATDKASRIKMVPYVVAMAYAVRIQLDVYYVESSGVDKADRLEYLERSSNVVEQFIEVLKVAVKVMLGESSLLEVAMDYHLALMMYVALAVALRVSAQMMSAPQDVPKTIALWDDGLSGIRSMFHHGTNTSTGANTTISLDSVREAYSWVQFIGHDLDRMKIEDLRNTAQVCDLLFVLGAKMDDRTGGSALHLAPDFKRTLSQLPSVHALRAAFCSKLAATLDTSPDMFQSTARIRNASDIPTLASPSIPTPPPACAPMPTSPPPPPPLPPHPASIPTLTPPPAPLSTPTRKRIRDPTTSVLGTRASPIALPDVLPKALQHTRTLSGHSDLVWCVAVSADGEFVVSGSDDGTAKVWSATTGHILCTFFKHNFGVNCVALFSDDQRAVSGGHDCTVRIWSLDTGIEQRAFAGHTDTVYAVAVSPDNFTVASTSGDQTVRLWDVVSGECQAILTGHSRTVNCVAFNMDGHTLASGSEDKTIKVWNARNHSLVRTINQAHTKSVLGLTFSVDGERLLSSSEDKSVKAWQWCTGELDAAFTGHSGGVTCVAMFPDNQTVASGSWDRTIGVWNVRSGKRLHSRLRGHTNVVTSVAVSLDGHTLVSGSDDNTVRVWTCC